MKNSLQKLFVSIKALALFFLLVSGANEAKSQATPITVFNTTGCLIWVAGVSVNPCTARCATAFFPVPPGGGPVFIATCGAPTDIWYGALFIVGPSPAFAVDMLYNPATGFPCGLFGPFTPQNCLGAAVPGVWLPGDIVVF